MEINRVGVLGCGLMGHGIAQICAQAGWEVVVREVDDEPLERGDRQDRQAARARGRQGRVEEAEAEAVRARINPTLDYGELAGCDLVDRGDHRGPPAKLEMWGEVDGIVKPGAVFATNTSSLPVAEQAAATGRGRAHSSASTSSTPPR